jgi:hypothetical protein
MVVEGVGEGNVDGLHRLVLEHLVVRVDCPALPDGGHQRLGALKPARRGHDQAGVGGGPKGGQETATGHAGGAEYAPGDLFRLPHRFSVRRRRPPGMLSREAEGYLELLIEVPDGPGRAVAIERAAEVLDAPDQAGCALVGTIQLEHDPVVAGVVAALPCRSWPCAAGADAAGDA